MNMCSGRFRNGSAEYPSAQFNFGMFFFFLVFTIEYFICIPIEFIVKYFSILWLDDDTGIETEKKEKKKQRIKLKNITHNK